MRNLFVLLLVSFGASQAGGCVVYDDGYYDDGYYEEPALITAQWRFTDLATSTETACPLGFDTVAVFSQPIDASGRALDLPYIDLFDCVDGVGTTDFLPPDVYASWIEVTNFERTKLYAESTSSVVDVIVRDAVVDSEILNDGGYFALDWNLIGETSNRNLTCSELGGPAIRLDSTSTRGAVVDQFACGEQFGVTGGFVAGDYTIAVSAVSGETTLGALTLDNMTIRDRNRITDLGSVSIPIANR